jgi:hypothetical protein
MRRTLYPLLAVSVLFLGVQSSLALTLSEVRTEIRRNVRDTASSSSLRRYSDTRLNALINEAQRSVVNETWPLSEVNTQSVILGTTYYPLASDAIKTWRVTLDSVALPELAFHQLDADNAGSSWLSSTGTPTGFFYDRSTSTVIGLAPLPSGTGSLKVYTYNRADDLSDDADVPYDGDVRLYPYHDLLVYHVSFRLLLEQNRITEADHYRALYDAGVELMNTNVGHKPVRAIKQSTEVKP